MRAMFFQVAKKKKKFKIIDALVLSQVKRLNSTHHVYVGYKLPINC